MFYPRFRRLFQHRKNDIPKVPKYLSDTYWWAYIHPNAVWFFERQWLVNLILWGNFNHLRNSAIQELYQSEKCLQVACVYGNFTEHLAKQMKKDSELHIIDVAEIQLENLQKKLGALDVHTHLMDSSELGFSDASFDSVVLFFLLHEMPKNVRASTVSEAMRVLKPGGKCVIVDYNKPHWANPFKYVMYPILRTLEPFALDLWENKVEDLLPGNCVYEKNFHFGGLYQKIVVKKTLTNEI